jgi:hypothetical protein
MSRARSGWPAVVVAILWGAGPAVGGDPAADVDFFEKEVRPLLVAHCHSCHSGAKVKGGLSLDGPEGWLRGGDLGPAVVPGQPDESLLVAAVRHEDESLKMPPKGKLSPAQVETLTRWVARGAPGPAAVAVRPARDGEPGTRPTPWAFRPLTDPAPPAVADAAWPRDGLDRFILAALEAKGLRPAPAADRRTLIRRVAFDLTGLPPTHAEVEHFLNDNAPDAYGRLVDRLLASPHYGERWGRHWLDLARYADSNGLDENVAHGNAWRYRDYVVAAFNADLPYDRFVTEQIAGDLLPPADSVEETHRRLVATGFLALGPKVLAEVDERKMEMDIVDEQLDTVGKAVLGLTLGCARCHDHKFDPISTADYYGLAGVFKSTRTMETFTKVARWHENSLANEAERSRKAAHDAEVAAKKEAIKGEKDEDALKRLKDELAALEKAAPTLPSAMGATEGTVADVAIHVRGSHLTLGAVVPRRVPESLSGPDAPSFSAAASGRLELARWLVSPGHPLTARVLVNRVWRWHFGRGLVGTPDNFGALGEPPSHPELLDWLARRFEEGGWSLKSLHRRIVLSSTYRMGSAFDAEAARIDPENRLRWRADVRRLEAEAIRDALLAVAGRLDRTMGGSLLTVANRGYFFDHTSRDATGYDSPRRSIYLPVVRNHLYDLFALFDATDASVPSGDRATTTVAPQALLMLNSDLVLDAARALAADLLRDDGAGDAERLATLYERAYGRPPTDAETRRAGAALGAFEAALRSGDAACDAPAARLGAWQALCQAVLAANEFVTIR